MELHQFVKGPGTLHFPAQDHAPETDVKPTNTLLEVLVPLDTARSATERTNIHPHAAEILVPHLTPEIEGVTGRQCRIAAVIMEAERTHPLATALASLDSLSTQLRDSFITSSANMVISMKSKLC